MGPGRHRDPPVTGRVRVALFFGVALALGAAFVGLRGSPVTILTGPGGISRNADISSPVGCYTSFIVGALVTDPTYGTAIIEHDPASHNPDRRLPVMWLPGDTGRTSGSEVEILDRTGSVIARTGQVWKIAGGFWGGLDNIPDAWVACGYVLPPPAGQ
jgi:hypothetical protein